MQAKDVRQLGHSRLNVRHEPVDDFRGRLECRLGQLRVNHGGLRIGVAKDLLNDAQIHSLFQQVGGPALRRDELRNALGYEQRLFCECGLWPKLP